jgi:hypothetical protein
MPGALDQPGGAASELCVAAWAACRADACQPSGEGPSWQGADLQRLRREVQRAAPAAAADLHAPHAAAHQPQRVAIHARLHAAVRLEARLEGQRGHRLHDVGGLQGSGAWPPGRPVGGRQGRTAQDMRLDPPDLAAAKHGLAARRGPSASQQPRCRGGGRTSASASSLASARQASNQAVDWSTTLGAARELRVGGVRGRRSRRSWSHFLDLSWGQSLSGLHVKRPGFRKGEIASCTRSFILHTL